MYDIEERILAEQPTVVVRAKLAVEDMPQWFPRTYGEIMGHLQSLGVFPAGPPFARYRKLNGDFEVEAGFPVPQATEGTDVIEPSTLPSGTVAATMHNGSYDTLGHAYDALEEWVAEHEGTPSGAPWEVYLTDPTAEPDLSTWRTEVYQPFAP